MEKGFQKKKDVLISTPTKRKGSQNCWEFWNCLEEIKKECSAYQSKMGRQCWLVSNMSKKNQTIRRNLECTNCEWYKKINTKK